MSEKILDCRFLARIVIKAETPLSVKSGEKDIITDAVVIRDVNGMPYIPGSSIAGVVRHAWKDMKGENKEQDVFGFQNGDKSGQGSRIIFSEARILNAKGKVMDGIQSKNSIANDVLLKYYEALPIRQHVRINHLGTAEDTGKFDEQVVFAGTCFCFEVEMIGAKEDEDDFKQLLSILDSSSFRLGSGTRSGFGKIKIVSIQYDKLFKNDLRYLEKSSNLEQSKTWYKGVFDNEVKDEKNGWISLKYRLVPDDFFLFGTGFGDEDADMTPVSEMKVVWNGDEAEVKEHIYLLPASSIKGAVAHRVAYHYNKLTKIYAEDFAKNGKNDKGRMEEYVGSNNKAVRLLFGFEGNEKNRKIRGNVIFSDLYDDKREGQSKILNHVAIDRFTGGAIDGALFSEKAVYGKGIGTFILEILVDEVRIRKLIHELYPGEKETEMFNNVKEALDNTLADICEGRLPLGGGVNRGHGVFRGKKIGNK